ncbi:MAG: hypothetical protein ACRCTY_06910, partial [Candidatus Adiutrix sp.]
MHKKNRILTLVLAFLTITAGFFLHVEPSQAQIDRKAVPGYGATTTTVITIAHWKDSTPNERYAFLVGFATMLELEQEWQKNKNITFEQSLVQNWVRGFDGLTLKDLYQGLNEFAAQASPIDLDRPVVEVMWFKFVQ